MSDFCDIFFIVINVSANGQPVNAIVRTIAVHIAEFYCVKGTASDYRRQRCDRDFCDKIRPVQCPISLTDIADARLTPKRLYAKYRFRVSRALAISATKGPVLPMIDLLVVRVQQPRASDLRLSAVDTQNRHSSVNFIVMITMRTLIARHKNRS